MMSSEEERRRARRTEFGKSLEYTLSLLDAKELRRIHSTGTGLDISDGGLGFSTEFPLEPGHILILRMEDDQTSYAAIVRWSEPQSSGRFRIGAMLCK